MNALGVTGGLVEPPPVDPVAEAIKLCEESIEDGCRRILDEDWRGYRGHEYEEGFQQGRKDMARAVLVTLAGREHVTTDTVRKDRIDSGR